MRLQRGVMAAVIAPSGAGAPPAASPSFRSLGTAAHGVGDITPGLPADREANDILVLFIESDNIDWLTGNPINPAAPTDWTAIRSSFTPAGAQPTAGSGVTGARITICWARSSTISAAPTITDPGDHCHAVIAAYKDCKAGADPFGVDATGGSSAMATTLTLPGITTPVDNSLVVYAVADGTDGTAAFVSGEANANLTGLAERYDASFNDASGGGLAFFDGLLPTAGASGNLTATISGVSRTYRYITFCLEHA